MKIIKIRGAASMTSVPILIPFQAAPGESFGHGEEILIQLVDEDGQDICKREKRSVVKTIDGDENNSAWYDAFIPVKK